MKKIVIWYAMLWYVIVTYYIYEVFHGTWNLFMIDAINLFSDSEEGYEIGILCISILFLFLMVFTCLVVKRIKIEITVKLKNKETKKYNFISCVNKCKWLLWSVIIGIFVYDCIYFYNQFCGENKIWEKYTTIAHAGGIIDGNTYSNCEEAIKSNYEKGQRIFEIDLALTSDDKIVGKHDWEEHIIQEGMVPGYIPSEEEFLEKPLWGKYTPLTFGRLCKVMSEYEDIWIMTDTKYADAEYNRKFFKILVETAKESGLEKVLERIIVQVYSEGMQDVVNEVYPFKSYIFTLYQLEFKGDEKEFLQYVRYSKKNNIDAITMSEQRISPQLIEIADRYGIEVYVHTLNEVERANEVFEYGVHGIYTDSLTPDMFIKENE